ATSTRVAPLPLGRSLGFTLVTVVAFVLDALTVIPRAQDRDGSRWPLWGAWEPSVLEFVPLMALVYAALLLRRRWPLTFLVGICLLSVAFTQGGVPALPMAGILVTLYTAAALAE